MMRLQASGDHPALQCRDRWSEPGLLLEVCAHGLQQEGGLVMFERTLGQPSQKWLMILGLHTAKAQMVQYSVEVRTAGHTPQTVGLEHRRVDLELPRQEGHHLHWRSLEMGGAEAARAYSTPLECCAQAICITVIGVNEGTVLTSPIRDFSEHSCVFPADIP